MKRFAAWLGIFLVVFSVSVISEAQCTFTDDTGEVITFTKMPEHTAVLFSSFADMWQLAGGKVLTTVGETVKRGIVSEDIALVDKGAGKQVDLEALIMSGADFVIGSCDIPSHVQARKALRLTGVPFALFRVESIEDYLRVLKIMTDINQNEDAYILFGEKVYQKTQSVIEKASDYKVKHLQEILFIRSGSSYSSAKAKTKDMHFAAKMLDDLGAKNIADEVPVIIDGLSFEEIFMKDPDAIFISLMGDEEASREYAEQLLSKREWQMLTAVKNGRCYFLPKELFQFKPNEQWADAYEMMAKMLYPEWKDEE
ncbi:MAG: ABC transporter substrate-binding protein [Clostridia bacterium]|nr:ABC transporter substrate-binding protein [Clostridia bacterium]